MCFLFVLSTLSTSLFIVCLALGDIKGSAVVRFFQSVVILTLQVAGLYYVGLIGAVLAPLLGYCCFSIWYFPQSITRLARIGKADWQFLSQEVLCSMFAAFLTFFIVNGIMHLPSNWMNFTAFICTTFFVYFSLLVLLSSKLKRDLSTLMNYLFKHTKLSGR
jgi:hypothetical protein